MACIQYRLTAGPAIPARGDVTASAVAELLGLSASDFEARRAELRGRDFPDADPTTGLYCIEAVDRWRLRRHPRLFPELTSVPARGLGYPVLASGRSDAGGPPQGFKPGGASTERLVTVYLERMAIELHPDAVLFRTRSGGAYGRETLAHDFAAMRAIAFPDDKRRLMDMRRSGVIEAVAGDAGPIGLAAKLANSIGRSNTLHKTYAPVDIEAVRNTDDARLKGRRKIRAGNKAGDFVSTQQSGDVSTFKPDGTK